MQHLILEKTGQFHTILKENLKIGSKSWNNLQNPTSPEKVMQPKRNDIILQTEWNILKYYLELYIKSRIRKSDLRTDMTNKLEEVGDQRHKKYFKNKINFRIRTKLQSSKWKIFCNQYPIRNIEESSESYQENERVVMKTKKGQKKAVVMEYSQRGSNLWRSTKLWKKSNYPLCYKD